MRNTIIHNIHTNEKGEMPEIPEGNAEAGKALFKTRCSFCHPIVKGKNGLGPNLFEVIGRKVGRAYLYRYSDALKKARFRWTKEKLWEYLKDPQNYFPGSKKRFLGIADPQKRADIVAYLEEASKKK